MIIRCNSSQVGTLQIYYHIQPHEKKNPRHYVTVARVCNLALRCATVENIWIQLVQSSEDNLKTQTFKNYT